MVVRQRHVGEIAAELFLFRSRAFLYRGRTKGSGQQDREANDYWDRSNDHRSRDRMFFSTLNAVMLCQQWVYINTPPSWLPKLVSEVVIGETDGVCAEPHGKCFRI